MHDLKFAEDLENYEGNFRIRQHDLSDLGDLPPIREYIRVNTKYLNKTMQQVADEAGVSISTLNKFMTGVTAEPSVQTVGRLCSAVRFDLNAYFNIKPLADPPEPDLELLERAHDMEQEIVHLNETKQLQGEAIDRMGQTSDFNREVAGFRKSIIIVQFAICVALLAALLFYVLLDIRDPGVGVFSNDPSVVGVIALAAVTGTLVVGAVVFFALLKHIK